MPTTADASAPGPPSDDGAPTTSGTPAAPEDPTDGPDVGGEAPADGPDLGRLAMVAGWVLLAATFVGFGIGIVRASDAWVVHQVPDDVFYYLEIGDNLAEGRGSTFDGTSETNGFHPVWQGVSTVVAAVVPHGTAQLRALLLAALVLTAAATLGAIRLLARVVGLPLALVGALVAVHGASSLQTLVNGMEAALVAAALVAVATAVGWYLDAPSTRRALVVGVVSGVAVLCRLDLVVVLPLVGAALWWRRRSLVPVRDWALGVAAVGVPALALWYAAYGRLLSVSGVVKDHWVDQAAAEHGGRLSAGWAGYVLERTGDYAERLWSLATEVPDGLPPALGWVVVGGLAAAGAVAAARQVAHRAGRPRLTDPEAVVVLLVAMLVAKAAVDLVTAPIWAVGWWYDGPQDLLLPMVVGTAAGGGVALLWRAWRPAGVVAAALGVLAVLPGPLAEAVGAPDEVLVEGDWRVAHWQAGEWIRDEGPTARYGAFDAGAVGYLTEAPSTLVNLDGLVNDYGYAELVGRQAGLEERLAHEDVEVLVRWLADDGADEVLPCATRLWRSPGAPGSGDRVGHVWVLDVRPCDLG